MEHLLRDVNDPSVSHLAAQLRHKVGGLRGFTQRLKKLSDYLTAVVEGELPANHEVRRAAPTRTAIS